MIRSILLPILVFLLCITITLFVRFLFPSLLIPLVLPAVVIVACELPQRRRHAGSSVLSFAVLGGLSLEVISSAPSGYYFVTTLIFAGILLVLVQRGILRDSPVWTLTSLVSILIIQYITLAVLLTSMGSLTLSMKGFVAPLAGTVIFGTIIGMMFRALFIRYVTHEQAFSS